MGNRIKIIFVLFVLLTNFLYVSGALADKSTDLFQLDIKIEPAQVSTGQEFTVAVNLRIAPGYYLYAHQTKLTPVEISGIKFSKVKKPIGEKVADPFLGTKYIYKDQIKLQITGQVDSSIEPGEKKLYFNLAFQGCTKTVCLMPTEKKITGQISVIQANSFTPGFGMEFDIPNSTDASETMTEKEPDDVSVQAAASALENEAEKKDIIQRASSRFGILGVMGIAFFWGILASLTPCIYPLIPVTISIIGANQPKNAWHGFYLSGVYVLGLSLTYAIFGVIAALTGGLFGAYTGHPVVRVLVAVIFTILALSMFDLFYIQMPSAVSSRFQSSKSIGAIGLFITGAFSGMVVGPCVGPLIIAILLHIAAVGSTIYGFFIMWSFALGVGVLLLGVGTFSGLTSLLPKAGNWMAKIKYFLGLVLLFMALYYVEPVFNQGTFLLLLGGLLIGVGVYLGALDTLGEQATGIKKLWKSIGIIVLVVGIGYVVQFPLGQINMGVKVNQNNKRINWVENEPNALQQAKNDNKPVLVDFTAEWCSACKKLEKETFSDPLIVNELDRFVALRIDCTDAQNEAVKKLQEKYNVIGLPTLVLLNGHKGEPILRITEFIKPGDLIDHLKKIR